MIKLNYDANATATLLLMSDEQRSAEYSNLIAPHFSAMTSLLVIQFQSDTNKKLVHIRITMHTFPCSIPGAMSLQPFSDWDSSSWKSSFVYLKKKNPLEDFSRFFSHWLTLLLYHSAESTLSKTWLTPNFQVHFNSIRFSFSTNIFRIKIFDISLVKKSKMTESPNQTLICAGWKCIVRFLIPFNVPYGNVLWPTGVKSHLLQLFTVLRRAIGIVYQHIYGERMLLILWCVCQIYNWKEWNHLDILVR